MLEMAWPFLKKGEKNLTFSCSEGSGKKKQSRKMKDSSQGKNGT